jgi:hypothetical protein
MRKAWQKSLPKAHLWWLNIGPGWGGRPFRGKKHPFEEEDVEGILQEKS